MGNLNNLIVFTVAVIGGGPHYKIILQSCTRLFGRVPETIGRPHALAARPTLDTPLHPSSMISNFIKQDMAREGRSE